MDNTTNYSNLNERSELGDVLIRWVKKIHEKKPFKFNGSGKGEGSSKYNDMISHKLRNKERLERKERNA